MNPVLPLSLFLVGASLAVARQADAPVPIGAPAAIEALPLTNASPQAQQAALPTEAEGSDTMPAAVDVNEPPEQSETNAVTEENDQPRDGGAQGGVRRRDGRQSRQNRFARERQRSRSSRDNSGSASASGTNGPASLDYSAFRDIARLNIFDPNRVASGPAPVRAPSAEFFGLVGTIRYEKGTFAFFTGSGSQYEKELKVSDSIAGYKLVNIATDSVKLLLSTNGLAADSVKLDGAASEVEMRMGQQMRREANGPWQLSSGSSSYAASSSFTPIAGSESTGTNSAAAGGPESEILKRLMQRRDRE
jgi:hypothetical protein